MKIMKHTLTLALTGSILTGCTTIKTDKFTADESLALNNKTVAIAHYQAPPDFHAQTALNVQFGLVGMATATSNGNAMIKNNNIDDPANKIANQLAEILASKHSIKVVSNTDIKVPNRVKAKEISDIYKDFDYVLDVRTLAWNSIYFVSDPNNYRVIYSARVRLIDTKSVKVLTESGCTHKPEYEDTNTAPSYKELESGTKLNESLNNAVEFCVKKFLQDTQIYASNNQARRLG